MNRPNLKLAGATALAVGAAAALATMLILFYLLPMETPIVDLRL